MEGDNGVLLSVRGLKQYFALPKKRLLQRKKTYLKAVDGVSLEILRGETFGLVGESGSGKSTLGRSILQLYKPTEGKVEYTGSGTRMELTEQDKKGLRGIRKDLQMIFQDPYSSLNPRMTVGQIIEEGVATHGLYKPRTKEMRAYVLDVMQKCGLDEYALNRYPHEFSGGQRQRVCIARALAVKPKFIVCDECVSALDVSIQAQILNLLADWKEQEGLTYLFISHDLSVVRHISDRIAVMYLGRIVEIGDSEKVFKKPLHPYTIALMRAVPTLSATKKKRIELPGTYKTVNAEYGCPFASRCFMAQEVCYTKPVSLREVDKGRRVACHFAEIPTAEKERTGVLKDKAE